MSPDEFSLDRFEEGKTHWTLDWPSYDDKQICNVQVARANKPVYVTSEGKEEFFVRKEGSSQPLSRAEEHEWNRGRF